MARGAAGKVPVFGILKRGGRVYTKVIPDTKAKTLMGIMQARIIPDSIVYTNTYRSYNVLVVSALKHYRINHSRRVVKKHTYMNGIENFWNQAKRPMRKFNGIPRQHFQLCFKECKGRFNTTDSQRQFAQLKQWVKPFMNSLQDSLLSYSLASLFLHYKMSFVELGTEKRKGPLI